MTTNARIEAVERTTGRSWDDWLAWTAITERFAATLASTDPSR